MNPSLFRNELMTKSAILGCVMLLFNIAELTMFCYGGATLMLPIVLVMLLSVAAYIFLVYRFTKNYSNLIVAERQQMPFFSYGEGLLYSMNLSGLAGVVVALGAYLYTHYVVGYDTFIDAYVALLQDSYSQFQVAMAESDEARELIESYIKMYQGALTTAEGSEGANIFEVIINEVKKAEEPSVVANLFTYMGRYVMVGALVGFVVAAMTKRNPWDR